MRIIITILMLICFSCEKAEMPEKESAFKLGRELKPGVRLIGDSRNCWGCELHTELVNIDTFNLETGITHFKRYPGTKNIFIIDGSADTTFVNGVYLGGSFKDDPIQWQFISSGKKQPCPDPYTAKDYKDWMCLPCIPKADK